ncbi:Zinc finger BED domain-containing protein 5 [Eumeta japonica]|uniref:Zinc finger BED domain-containing protein 5 n=1 Tax=Eumeta variegata TaxID=151549 RepID=A0A4C1YUG6_EUMVA|nr:Zinc finger BED domain-containing protein 5 [Eumeta japonica]
MDESTDVAGLAILLVIVRYPYESSFEEDMLMCSPLPTNITWEEIFNKINIFFEENNLSRNDCIDICTDEVKTMTRKTAGAMSRIKNKAPNCSSSHYILHRQALAMKQMPSNRKLGMDEALTLLSNALRTRLATFNDTLVDQRSSKVFSLHLYTNNAIVYGGDSRVKRGSYEGALSKHRRASSIARIGVNSPTCPDTRRDQFEFCIGHVTILQLAKVLHFMASRYNRGYRAVGVFLVYLKDFPPSTVSRASLQAIGEHQQPARDRSEL